ncbi:MAG: EutN/CcmL family microcompartment protein [Planctomycetes bacterium]|nr:EutN/CcmL family microcompartment protein [Planctomycetota bacterium]
MNLARVIGTVWATRKDENFTGAKFLVVQPVDDARRATAAPLVAVDTVGAGVGETVFYVTAREALLAYKRDLDHLTPCDAAIIGIVETINGRDPG